MFVQEKSYTVDEFLALVNAEAGEFELIAEEIVEVSPSKAKQTTAGIVVGGHIAVFVTQNDLGYLTGADGGFKLSETDFFTLDAAFISKEKLPNGIPDDDFYRVAPDLAVEVVSKSDQATAPDKALRYLALGTRLVWVLYTQTTTVHAYRPVEKGAFIQVFKMGDVLEGGDILPGFKLAVKDIFLK